MKLVLFDIDGTIMDWPQEHKDSFAVAIKNARNYGRNGRIF